MSIFFSLKSAGKGARNAELHSLLESCDIMRKSKAKSKTLSGGQKRKVQLAMMFAGGSAVCCVDEVSSGLDPLSRRKVWDILLAQRSTRTIIMTTHFLDEADFLSDNIAILSKGLLKAEGSSAELKQRFGNGYTIETMRLAKNAGNVESNRTRNDKSQSLSATDPGHAMELIETLERNDVYDYRVSGPTLEDVFLRLVGTSLASAGPTGTISDSSKAFSGPAEKEQAVDVTVTEMAGVNLHDGKHLNAAKQGWVLFVKRLMVFRRKWGPHLSALILALIGAGVSPLFLKDSKAITCGVSQDQGSYATSPSGYTESLATLYDNRVVGGPFSPGLNQTLANIAQLYPGDYNVYSGGSPHGAAGLPVNVYAVNSLQEFNAYISNNTDSVTPGGFWLGDASSFPVIAWSARVSEFVNSIAIQNVMNNVLTNMNITTSYAAFDIPLEPQLYDFGCLLFAIYFSMVFCLYPAFYALYPTAERLRQARALQYSNGVRPLPMWLAYLAFELLHILVISIVSTALLSIGTSLWFHLPYIFLILTLYGIAATLLGYLISMFAKSQLSAWAFCASGQIVMCLAYFAAYLGVQTSVEAAGLEPALDKIQYTIGLISPIANVMRSIFVALNQFTIDCGHEATPGIMELYGGPILYLILQCFALFAILILWDSGKSILSVVPGRKRQENVEDSMALPGDASKELARVHDASSGLRVMNLSKSFGRNIAVDDVSFGVEKSEVVTLLGPNGAGKCEYNLIPIALRLFNLILNPS